MKLIEPKTELDKEYGEMLKEWHKTGEELVPFVLRFDSSDFNKYVGMLSGFKNGIGIPDDFVPHTTFWLVDDDEMRIYGVMNLRHRLNDKLLLSGGHVGYGVRPSERRKGCATKMLALGLIEAKKIGINKVLVTCDKDNIASARTIINNRGKFYKENLVEGEPLHLYWIDNK